MINLSTFPKVIENETTFQFSFEIPKNSNITESIRGKYISIDYCVYFQAKLGAFQTFEKSRTFFVCYKPPINRPTGNPVDYTMDSKNCKKGSRTVHFHASIHLDTPVASIKSPPRGLITIIDSSDAVSQITISYMRKETISIDRSNPIVNTSEICRMQIAENDPPHGVIIPFNLEWIRLLIAPDVETNQFKIETSLKIRILFGTDGYATYAIPLVLVRDLVY